MVYLVPSDVAKATVEQINNSPYSIQTGYELALNELRRNYSPIPKSELQDGKCYGVISVHFQHVTSQPDKAYLEVWTYHAKGAYRKDTDMLVSENAWNAICEKRVTESMVLCKI